jgi:RHS repeat-associated protein
VITKNEVSIVPHQNWRGQFTMGTWGVSSGGSVGAKADCTNSNQTGCLWIPWPGQRTNVRHALADTATIQNWWGGLVDGMRDASGQMYMRNRYYDPSSGQFTQPDPIGLAGGLNAYGFANGDPISYSDPLGLCSTKIDKSTGKSVDGGTVCKLDPVVVTATVGSKHHDRCEVGTFLRSYVRALENNPISFVGLDYPAGFDPKFESRGDLYEVGDQWLSADEFGNYAAGYAGQRAYVEAGHGLMLGGGFWYAIRQRPRGSGEHWSDRESRPMINAGASRARSEQYNDGRTRGMRGGSVVESRYIRPLTSPAGC